MNHVFILSEKLLLVLVDGGPDMVRRIEEYAADLHKQSGVKMLIFGGIKGTDIRRTPPKVTEAAKTLVAWLEEQS